MKWTTEQPTKLGWYWYRATPTGIPYPMKVFHIAEVPYVWPLDDAVSMPRTLLLGECAGEWYGPMEEPPRGLPDD